MTFANRLDAGRQLGEALLSEPVADPVVVGVSRGGVPVAAEVAQMLHAPLEICVVRKLFSPGSPSFAIGAIAERGAVCLDDAAIEKLQLSPNDVEQAIALEALEVERLSELLRDGPPLELRDRDVILVDDAVMSIATLRAAARSSRAQRPHSLVLAVPIADIKLLEQLRPELDRIVCLLAEPMLGTVAARYRELWPVSENEVVALLAEARRAVPPPLAAARGVVAGGPPRLMRGSRFSA
jgi:putative phosphoribosyl transferase